MFGLGFGEIVIILILALVLLGPQRLPDAAKQLGKSLREFKKATDDLKSQFEGELYETPTRRPKLVDAPAPASPDGPPATVPPGGVPAAATVAPAATLDNVPGLEAAVAEAVPGGATQPVPAPHREGSAAAEQPPIAPEPPPAPPAAGKPS
jgi:sec-independent protein translocase protein TatB